MLDYDKKTKGLSRRFDLLLVGFSKTVMNDIPPVDASKITHHELTWAVSLGDQQLPIEAVAHSYAQKLDREVPENEHDLLDFICRTGISGGRTCKRGRRSVVHFRFDLI